MRVYQAIAIALQAQDNCRRACNREWGDRWSEELQRLREVLPSGSGFDSGTEIEELDYPRAREFRLYTSYHHMDQDGFYDGWSDWELIVRPEFDGFSVEVLANSPEERDNSDDGDIEDYIGETFDQALDEPFTWSWDEARRSSQ